MDKSVDLQHYYLELSPEPVRFDAVSQLTNVFFDDAKQQVFAVRSGGATGIVVKSATDGQNISFCMEDRGTIRSIKFSADNQVLAVQRNDTSVEFVPFNANNQPNVPEMLTHQGKNIIYGFVWVQERQVALISKAGVEIFQLNFEKRTLKSVKSLNITVNWFSFCPTSNFALLSSNMGTILTPVILKASTITKLPRLELGTSQGCSGRDVTLAQLYGTNAIMILRQLQNRQFEVVIYLLNGPGLAPKKSHILRLGQSGRFAMNIVDDVVVVHHQASATSMLFDIALGGAETEVGSGAVIHQPIIPAKTIKPYTLEVPSMSLDGKTINCDLYSQHWVLFQPNIVIDAKLGCLWHVLLKLNSLCALITDRFRLVEFLLQRTEGKPVLLNVLKEMMSVNYSGTMLPVIESIFNKLNCLYKSVLDNELQSQMALMALSTKSQSSKLSPVPRVIVDQSDAYTGVFSSITDTEQLGKILLLYLHSLARNGITANPELSKQIVIDLVRNKQFDTLHQLLKYSALNESKPLACFLLSLSNSDPSISQMALDMLARLNANEIILEVLLEKGQVVEALRIAKQMPGADSLPARKYLEAAYKTKDPLVFHSVYNFFQAKNVRLRGSPDFLKHEQCTEYVQYYQTLISTQCL
ncbi:regulator of MON1-CCZ1 complex [Wyeomyia smithii]|uniref:regulator of MON1-CCZ1 complex n=1 Tax=Wyeomyia smithii TaxID=174621 RepID=UPI002467F3FE|nr:regulator of MON1-CCZ1 complex [Wyeomyia smithii]XP_055528731.1 regulator of MON1-CCZ1 complex [Wyeomyia smithii]